MKKLTLLLVLSLVTFQSYVNAQQLKVSSTGNVGINNNNPTYKLDVGGNVRFVNSGKTVTFEGTTFGPSTTGIDCGTASYYWSRLYSVNEFFTYAPVIQSDGNYKINVVTLTGMNDKLKLLRAVSYNLKDDVAGITIDKTQNKTQYGFIAQELQKVFPDMVTAQDNGILGIQYTELIPVLVQALKEQQDQIDLLNERIQVLESSLK